MSADRMISTGTIIRNTTYGSICGDSSWPTSVESVCTVLSTIELSIATSYLEMKYVRRRWRRQQDRHGLDCPAVSQKHKERHEQAQPGEQVWTAPDSPLRPSG